VDPRCLRALFTQGVPVASTPDAAYSLRLQFGLQRGRSWISHLSRRGMFYGGYDTVSNRAAARHLCAIWPWPVARRPHSRFLLSAGHEARIFATGRGVTGHTINPHILERDDTVMSRWRYAACAEKTATMVEWTATWNSTAARGRIEGLRSSRSTCSRDGSEQLIRMGTSTWFRT
jgi:hypothetical protein